MTDTSVGTDQWETEGGTSEPEETTAERLVRELKARVYGDRILMQFTKGIISPMELAKLMGVRPQMIYQDIASGKLAAAKHNNTQKWVVAQTIAIEYASKYLDRKAQRQTQQAQEVTRM